MPFIETHRSFINAWECDENDHLNVQFYFKRFAEAAEVFAVTTGGERNSHSLPKSRHVRYLRELRDNASIAIKSALIGDGEMAGCVIHLLENLDENTVSATSVDQIEGLKQDSGLPVVASLELGPEASNPDKGLQMMLQPT